MLRHILGSNSTAAALRGELDAAKESATRIARNVANASTPGFNAVLDDAMTEGTEGVDLEKEMIALADEQLRFEASAQLLSKIYQQARVAIREG